MVFKERELDRLNCSESDKEIILAYQKKLPVLTNDNEIEKFCVNTRTLWEQLEVGKVYMAWIKDRIQKYELEEEIDYTCHFPNRERAISSGGHNRIDYIVTLDIAKELSMITNNENGKIARKYYIAMERIVRDNKSWFITRNAERSLYKPMCQALSDSLFRLTGRNGDDYDFSREANILNIIATGMRAIDIKLYLRMGSNDLTRDGLLKDYNDKILFLQEQNIILLGMDMKLLDRVNMLIKMFDVKYPDAKSLSKSVDIIAERNKMISELTKPIKVIA